MEGICVDMFDHFFHSIIPYNFYEIKSTHFRNANANKFYDGSSFSIKVVSPEATSTRFSKMLEN